MFAPDMENAEFALRIYMRAVAGAGDDESCDGVLADTAFGRPEPIKDGTQSERQYNGTSHNAEFCGLDGESQYAKQVKQPARLQPSSVARCVVVVCHGMLLFGSPDPIGSL